MSSSNLWSFLDGKAGRGACGVRVGKTMSSNMSNAFKCFLGIKGHCIMRSVQVFPGGPLYQSEVLRK